MRGAPAATSSSLLQYTTIALPHRGESAFDPGSATVGAAYSRATAGVPLRDTATGAGSEADANLRTSAYDRAYALAQRLTGGRAHHIRRGEGGGEPPPARLPLQRAAAQRRRPARGLPVRGSDRVLPAVLRGDGAPAPNGRDSAGGNRGRILAGLVQPRHARVPYARPRRPLVGRGLFRGDPAGSRSIPLPQPLPAESQSSGLGATSAARADAGEVRSGSGAPTPERTADGTRTGQRGRGGGPCLAGARAARRGRRYRARRVALAQVQKCTSPTATWRRRSSPSFAARSRPAGFALPAAITLLALEQRLGRLVGPASARYAAALREHRFDPRAPDGPGPAERRALRRELSARGGPRARLRGLLAIPPGGPRPL